MRRLIVLFTLLLICYAYVLPRWADWNQNSRLNLVLALVDDQSVSIDRYVANTGDYALYNGRAYSDKPPGLSLLALPAYLGLSPVLDLPPVRERLQSLGGGAAFAGTLNATGSGLLDNKLRFALVQYILTLLTVATPAALLGVLFAQALERLGVGPRAAALGALAYGLGTAAAPYAGNFYSHQLVAALLFGAFLVAWPREGEVARFSGGLLCGLLLGWAVISEFPIAPAAALIGGYALFRRGWPWLLPLALGGILPGLLLIVYDLVAFGTPLPVGYAHSALWQEQHHTGFMSITYPRIEALWGLTFSGFRGLFVRSPWLLLAAPGYMQLLSMRQRRPEWWVLLSVPGVVILFYSSSIMWWGGFTAGPRYIVPMIPFLALPVAWWIAQQWGHPLKRLGAVALALLSIGLTWAEATAAQSFPPDTLRDPWGSYVLPAWAAGDIARNLGMALGLRGSASLLPLGLLLLLGGGLLIAVTWRVPGAPSRPVASGEPAKR